MRPCGRRHPLQRRQQPLLRRHLAHDVHAFEGERQVLGPARVRVLFVCINRQFREYTLLMPLLYPYTHRSYDNGTLPGSGTLRVNQRTSAPTRVPTTAPSKRPTKAPTGAPTSVTATTSAEPTALPVPPQQVRVWGGDGNVHSVSLQPLTHESFTHFTVATRSGHRRPHHQPHAAAHVQAQPPALALSLGPAHGESEEG